MTSTPPTGRRRRGVQTGRLAPETQPPSHPPAPAPVYCPHCGYQYGGMGDTERTSAELAAASETGIKVECPECDRRDVPVRTKPEKKTIAAPPIPRAVEQIIESVFRVDYEAEWKRLHENLVVGEERGDSGTVTRSLDFAEDNARSAHKLWVNMKLEYERYKTEREVIWGTMRAEATAALQAEKDQGSRDKRLTEADVTAKIAEMYPDEFRDVEIRKKKFELAVEHAGAFSDLWSSKCRSLQTMLSKLRGGGER